MEEPLPLPVCLHTQKRKRKPCRTDDGNHSSGMTGHSGDSKYTSDKSSCRCEVCAKQFTDLGSLQRHLRIHTGECPYRCEVCGKPFSRSDNLKTHVRIHTGECPYRCEVCGKQFSQPANLKTHLRIHTGECPYRCEVCGKQCRWSQDLKSHMRIHTGERPYRCEVCGKQVVKNIILKDTSGFTQLNVPTNVRCVENSSIAQTISKHM